MFNDYFPKLGLLETPSKYAGEVARIINENTCNLYSLQLYPHYPMIEFAPHISRG